MTTRPGDFFQRIELNNQPNSGSASLLRDETAYSAEQPEYEESAAHDPSDRENRPDQTRLTLAAVADQP